MFISLNFLLFVMVAAFTPGPNNAMIMASGLNHGVKASMPHFMGIILGVPTMFLAVGFGLLVVVQKFPMVYAGMQILGVIYLLYLAYLIATSAPMDLSSSDGGKSVTKPFSFIQAALFQWVNPKTWMMGTGALAAFIDQSTDLAPQVWGMALVFMLMAMPSAGVWMYAGSWLKRLFSQPSSLIAFNRVMAAFLVLSILPVVAQLIGARV